MHSLICGCLVIEIYKAPVPLSCGEVSFTPSQAKPTTSVLQVRHFLWIKECIKEQFLMPIAPYTLDGNLADTAAPDVFVADTYPPLG